MNSAGCWPFWQGYWSARSVEAVEVNGYTIEPGAYLEGADLTRADHHLQKARVCCHGHFRSVREHAANNI